VLFLAVLRAVRCSVTLAAQRQPGIGLVAKSTAHNMEDFSLQALLAAIHKHEEPDEVFSSYKRMPVQLIRFNDDGSLEMHEEGISLLRQVPGKIAVVGVCGPSNTGKSCLLNLLMHGKGEGFRVSYSQADSTQGIWIWGEPIRTKEHHILFLDCQGTKDINEAQINDCKLYAIMAIMTSALIFNSKGAIDNEVVKQLAVLAFFSEIIDFGTGFNDSEQEIAERIAAETPRFVWLLRDFNLAIVDDDGNTMSAKAYMENVMGMKSFMSQDGEKLSKISQAFMNIFKERECFLLPRPVSKEKDLQNSDLSSRPPSSVLNSTFLSSVPANE
jgi:hypothetical protein